MPASLNTAPPLPAPSAWLIRIPELFAVFVPEILQHLEVSSHTRLGQEYFLIKLPNPARIAHSSVAMFISWNLPVHHSWPCRPQKMEGFVEKAALTLAGKFENYQPQAFLTAPLQPGLPQAYFKSLASNLRGRALQVFAPFEKQDAVMQDPQRPTLYCLVGQEGLFAGLQSPRDSGGFHAGGTHYIKQEPGKTISRAAAKVAEALHHVQLYRPLPAKDSRWLELGASPGGMTAELLSHDYRVTAVDRAPLEPQLNGRPGLTFVKADAATFQLPKEHRFDALLCDLNGDPRDAISHVVRLSSNLNPRSLIIFTLKTPGAETLPQLIQLHNEVASIAIGGGLHHLATTHLTYNRQEFTMFFESGR